MCHYITMIVPKGADMARVREVLDHHKRGCEEIENRSVAKLMKPGERYLLTTRKHCDCGTMLGSSNRPEQFASTGDYESEIAVHRRKGWSEAKIGRWLQDKRKAENRKLGSEISILEAAAEEDIDPDGWVACIRALHRDAGLQSVGLLLHWYSGPLSERVTLKRQTFPAEQPLAFSLVCMDEDVIYDIA